MITAIGRLVVREAEDDQGLDAIESHHDAGFRLVALLHGRGEADAAMDLRRAPARLPLAQRTAVVLRHYLDLPYVHIAAITGTTETDARARCIADSVPSGRG